MSSPTPSASSPPPTNRLTHATSPYLLQHAHNPVDWYPWGPEALEKSRLEDKPIFLSIGYSACHWCHVMEREVFENADIAAYMNAHFVNIKVDREERPDIDELYMLATQIATGSGGWPMSLWLTPEREPFFAGTYLPPVDSYGRPGFPRVCQGLVTAWLDHPDAMRAQARKLVEAVQHFADETTVSTASAPPLDLPTALREAIEQFADRFDPQYGGLGSAPKFPPSTALPLWLELLKVHEAAPPQTPIIALPPESKTLLRTMLTTTLDHMARGGIYDHLGGGFSRYSTDEQWLIPHFEKMLYDNTQLAPAYALAGAAFSRPDFARIARQTLDFFLREMSSPQGSFFTALDADSEGHEGRFYTWTISQIKEVLPDPHDAQLIIDAFGVTPEGNFHEPPRAGDSGDPKPASEGLNVLHLARSVEQLAAALPTEPPSTPAALHKRFDALCLILRHARDRRPHPLCDDKILTAYNGLMISALAIIGRLQHEPNYLEAAHRAMGYLLLHHMAHGRHLLRTTPHSELQEEGSTRHSALSTLNSVPAFLEDHAFLLNAMCDLIDATSPTSLPGTMARKRALELADTMIREFEDPLHGGFFLSSSAHDPLFARLKNATDGATPSPNAVAIRSLLRLAQSSGREQYRETALRAVAAFAELIQKNPSRFPTILLALLEDAQFHAKAPHLGLPTPALEAAAPTAGPSTQSLAPAHVESSPAPAHCTLDPVTLPLLQRASSFLLPLTVHIAPGFHIQSQAPRDRESFATVARLRTDLPIVAQEWSYPDPIALPGLPSPDDRVWSDTITLTARITLAPHCPPGPHTLHIILLAQPCSLTSCLPPEKVTLDIAVQIAP